MSPAFGAAKYAAPLTYINNPCGGMSTLLCVLMDSE
jgi:hypothetical protein